MRRRQRERMEITVASLPNVSGASPSCLPEPRNRSERMSNSGGRERERERGGRERECKRERERCHCRWRALETTVISPLTAFK